MQAKTVDSATRLSTLTHKKRHSTPNSIIAKRRCIALKCQTFRDLGLTPTVSMEVFREVRGVAMESDRPQSPDVAQWTEPRRIPISPGLCESWILGSSPCKAKQLEFDSVSDSPEKDGVNSVNRITTKSTLEVGQLSQKTSESETTNGSTKSDSLIPNPLPNRPKVLFNYDDEIPCSQQSTNECEELKNNFAENTNATTPIADSLSSRRRLTTSFQYVEDQSQSSETSQQQSQGQTPRIQQWPPASESNLTRKALRGKFAAPRLSRCESGSVRNSETNKATQFGDIGNNPTETPRKSSTIDMECTPSENSIHVADVTETPIHTSVKIATETSVPVDNCSTSTTQSTCATSETAVAKCETGSMLNPAPTPSLFTTGSGKSVKFSAKALAEAKKAIEASETDSVPSTPAPTPSLLTTGSGKSVKFSAKALAEAKKAMEASETDSVPSTPAPAPSLFTTGSGKSVKFSAKALAEAKMAIEASETETLPSTPAPAPSLFTTGSGKSVKFSAKALAEAKKAMEASETDSVPSTPAPAPSLFSTGSGKSVKFSAKALAEAKMAIEASETDSVPSTPAPAPSLFSTGSGKSVKFSANAAEAKKTIEASETETEASPSTPAPAPSLFTTGSGKSVKFSAKALAEAKMAIEASETDSVPSTPAPAPSLFSTGSGKSVKFSAKALAEAKMAIEASETETLPSTPAPAPSLFTTGSGKSVKFSAKALAEAKKAMEASETDSVPSTPAPAPSLFSTGSGKSVKFSAKALAEAKKTIEASETETEALPSTPAPAPSLFTTGSGKSVKFSAKALDAAAKAMEDTIESNSGMGFAATAIPEPESLVKELRSGRHPKVGGNVVGGVVSDQNKLAGIKSVNRSAFKSPRPAASNLPSSVTANVRKPLVPLSSSMRNHGAQNVQQTPLQSSTRPQPRQPQGGSSPVPPRRLRFQSPRIDGSDSLGARQSKPANQRSQRKVALRIPRSPKRTISQKLPISSLGPLPKPSTCVRVAQSFGVRDAVLQITSKNAWLVQFDDGTGVPTSIREELEGKDLMQRVWLDFQTRVPEAAKYVNVSWITNHFRWIVWKLAAMERMFPMSLDGELILLYSKALDQLSARFHREQICTERPVVRKILEKDISCRVHMVLCVARIISEQEMVARLELTDGWYSIETQAGPGICSLLRQGRIAVGQKLQVSGAQMLHNESGVDPLQCLSNNPLSWTNATDCARFSQPLLSIDVNNIKPAPWYATLGICNPAKVPRFEKTLSSARPGGGTVPFLQVVIDRVYPLMFREKLSDGSAVFRDEAAETKVAESELQRHFEEKQSKLNSKLAQLNCQNGVVGVNDMQHIRDQLEREFVPSSPMRDVSAFVRVRVVQYHRDESKRTDQTHPYGELTIWDASPEMLRTFKEGHRCELQNVRTVRGGSVGSLRLVANRQSRWSVDDNPCSESEKQASKYMPRKCWEFEELISSADSMSEQHMEIDTVFAVVRCEAKHCFVANHSGFFAALELPSSEPQTELLRIGKVLAVQNLEFVGRDPQLPLLRFRWSAQRTISLSRMPTNLKSTNWSHCTETVAKWQNDSQVSNTSNCMSTVWQNRMNELIDTVLNGTATELQARVETLVDEGFTIASVQSVRGNELSNGKGSLGDAVERTYGAPAMTSSSAVTSPNYAQLKKREKPVTNSTMYSPKRLRAQYPESGSVREIWVRNETLTKIMLARINVHVHGGGLGISKDCIGDTIRFKCGELFQDCRVKDCHEYPSLSLLVESEGVRNILAQPMSVAEAVNQLQILNKHKKNSKAQLMESVIALRIDPIDSI